MDPLTLFMYPETIDIKGFLPKVFKVKNPGFFTHFPSKWKKPYRNRQDVSCDILSIPFFIGILIQKHKVAYEEVWLVRKKWLANNWFAFSFRIG